MRTLAALSLSIYASMLLIGLSYMALTVHFGITETVVFTLISIACFYSGIATWAIFSDKYTHKKIELNLRQLLIVCIVTVILREEPQEIYYVGVPSIFLTISVLLLYFVERRKKAPTRV